MLWQCLWMVLSLKQGQFSIQARQPRLFRSVWLNLSTCAIPVRTLGLRESQGSFAILIIPLLPSRSHLFIVRISSTLSQLSLFHVLLAIFLSSLFPLNTSGITSHLQLADPSFGQPGRIDLLLGIDIFAEMLLHGQRPDSLLPLKHILAGFLRGMLGHAYLRS